MSQALWLGYISPLAQCKQSYCFSWLLDLQLRGCFVRVSLPLILILHLDTFQNSALCSFSTCFPLHHCIYFSNSKFLSGQGLTCLLFCSFSITLVTDARVIMLTFLKFCLKICAWYSLVFLSGVGFFCFYWEHWLKLLLVFFTSRYSVTYLEGGKALDQWCQMMAVGHGLHSIYAHTLTFNFF